MREQKRLGNKGFSLVELIVVIAIMAILIAVIAPTLISKIEESRESTDLSTVGEVRTQIVNMLADEKIYKELVKDDVTSVYNVAADCTITEEGVEKTNATKELQDVISEFEFKSSAAEGESITVRINSKGKVYAFVAGDDGNPATISDGVLAAGSEISAPTE